MATIPRILVVDDDPDVRQMTTQFLRQNGTIALLAATEAEVRKHLDGGRVDLILLDVMLGDENGLEICQHLRAEQDVPIILVSALSADHQRMAGYEVGADDYIAKPFNPELLLARAKAVLSRARRSSSLVHRRKTMVFRFNGWTYDAKRDEVLSPDGVQVALSRRETRLLQALLSNPHIPLTREEIAAAFDVTGTAQQSGDALGRSIDVLVGRLRTKIEANPKDPQMLRTERGVGYVFSVDVVADGHMTFGTLSLRNMGLVLVLVAVAIGILGTWVWMQSSAQWRAHQVRADAAGVVLHNALQNGTAPPRGVQFIPLSQPDQTLAQSGQFRRISSAPQAARITTVPILADITTNGTSRPLTLIILSPDLQYRLADLPRRDGQTAAETTGSVFRLLASYCSDPLVLAHMGDRPWVQIAGAPVWGCAAAPPDQRLWAAIAVTIALAVLITIALNATTDFRQFGEQLRSRRRLGGPAQYDTSGPQELREIVSAVNAFLQSEREQLAKRAVVLSGVSHDLCTPATRLRLRTALIQDVELREKLEADIDSMTGMIESVLTYTRAEMSTETPRKLSLNSLVDAIVSDYQDMGSSVTFRHNQDQVVVGGRSVFMSRQGQSVVRSEGPAIVVARPISLERAVCNLIDNALKYGRRATVALEMDPDTATIIVDDEGSDTSAAEIEDLMAPFQRGDNTTSIEGYGLGLTIVATIAALHGGALQFEDYAKGLRARLIIQRS